MATISLVWTAPSGSGIVGYRIYRSGTIDGTYSDISGTLGIVTSYDDTTAIAGTHYFYKIKSIGEDSIESFEGLYILEGWAESPTPPIPPTPTPSVDTGEIVQITDFSSNINLLLEQYKQSENLKGILTLMNAKAISVEQALFEIRDNFWLSSAVGIQLDVMGLIFNFPRLGLSDTDYRLVLLEKSALLLASGEPDKIIRIIKLIYGATYVTYIPSFPAVPAGFYILTDGTINEVSLNRFAPSGVQAYLGSPLTFEDGDYLTLEDGTHLFSV